MSASTGLNLAARLVADMYDAISRPDLSGMIRADDADDADDFPEIKAAAAWQGMSLTAVRLLITGADQPSKTQTKKAYDASLEP